MSLRCLPDVSQLPDVSKMSPRCLPEVSQVSLRCLPDVSQMSPRCLSDVSQMSLRCVPDVSQMCSSIGHILVLRCKTCALLRAKTSALLRRKTCAVLRARTCALFRANTKEAAFGRLHKGGRPSVAPLCGFLCIGSEHSRCPSSMSCVSDKSRCLGSQQGTCLASQK